MRYDNIRRGRFIARPNRFIALVDIDGKEEVCHVKNTGRCRELLVPGAAVILQKSDNPHRKTKYDLLAVYKGDMLVNIDSRAPNKIAAEYLHKLFPDIKSIRPEAGYMNSRFDFYIETGRDKIFAEVKGVTLEENGVAMFPDAPTDRGVRHNHDKPHTGAGFRHHGLSFCYQVQY
ncbi:MAG TPA: DNA/RNA nuclease SfsA [Clostridiales bacterium]|nr:DNA/RNA nuclease SfsA [Clostridiales bacterium]